MADLNIDEFDFGFTAVDESELEAVQSKSAEVSAATDSVADTEEKLNKLYNAILPLLSNLKRILKRIIYYGLIGQIKLNNLRIIYKK